MVRAIMNILDYAGFKRTIFGKIKIVTIKSPPSWSVYDPEKSEHFQFLALVSS